MINKTAGLNSVEAQLFNKGRNFLFAIGINQYHHFPKLNNAVKDVLSLSEILISKYNFNQENVLLLLDEEATRSNILNFFRQIIKTVSNDDNVLIYFSGHGLYDTSLDEGNWLPVDARHEDGNAEFISNTSIAGYIRAMKAQHVFLISDSCFSSSLLQRQGSFIRGIEEKISSYPSRWALTSGKEENSDETPNNRSSFANIILEFLEKNESDIVPISQLTHYVEMNISTNSRQFPYGGPLHGLGDEGGQMILFKKKSFQIGKNEEIAWQSINNNKSISLLESFIRNHPNGKYLSEAENLLEELKKEVKTWEIARESNSNKAFRSYLDKFPAGKYAALAREKIQQLSYSQQHEIASKRERFALGLCRSISEYTQFMNLYPDSIYLKEAKNKIDELSEWSLFFRGCRDLIRHGKTEEVINNLLIRNTDFDNQVLLISNQWQTILVERATGVIDINSFRNETNRINHGVVELLRIIEKQINEK